MEVRPIMSKLVPYLNERSLIQANRVQWTYRLLGRVGKQLRIGHQIEFAQSHHRDSFRAALN